MIDYISYFFWISLFIVIYSYFGYAILLFIFVKIKSFFINKTPFNAFYGPRITLLVAAYNEAESIKKKIENSLSLDYPRDKIQFLFISDGSEDETPRIIGEFPEVQLMHKPEREGKIMAIDRAMAEVTGEIVVFSDANSLLSHDSLKNIVRHFEKDIVGVVSGEKRILSREIDDAAGAGEGIYWKYESMLKKWDYELYSVMGAAGELYAIRTKLFEKIPSDTLIEDFYLSFKIIQKGYKIAYEPDAFAAEAPSNSVKEELKRKIRIAAGGIQSIVRLKELLNPFKYGVITFQYISHRVLRWTLTPLALPIIFVANGFLWNQEWFYNSFFIAQICFYVAAISGFVLEKKQIRYKLLFIPYYFCIMNYAVYAGFYRYLRGTQTVLWERAERREF